MTNQNAPGIVARDVCKSFGDHLAWSCIRSMLRDRSSSVSPLGPNGAGKTTSRERERLTNAIDRVAGNEP
jgi:ABC-type branched-subunit amino acid transport system ATPase component